MVQPHDDLRGFLSCLFGSELFDIQFTRDFDFLSCLFGSERDKPHGGLPHIFLSCLFGSEHLLTLK